MTKIGRIAVLTLALAVALGTIPAQAEPPDPCVRLAMCSE
jgi:hypothetical protein